jgi:hypothetical protein
MSDMTERRESTRRIPLQPSVVMPPIADSTKVDPSGKVIVEVSDLCDRAGIRYRVTGGRPPSILLRDYGGHVRGQLEDGRDCFIVDLSELPSEDPERSMRILELLVRGFGCYQADLCICDRGYFSPDISMTYSGKVIIKGDDR